MSYGVVWLILMNWDRPPYTVSDNASRLSFDVIHDFLTHAYWSPGVSRERVERAARHSLTFGVYAAETQIGYARVITDHTNFAYIADVFVLEDYRGQGLSKFLMRCILDHPELRTVRRFLLVTSDAHKLYAQFGFSPPAKPEMSMELVRHPAENL